MQVKSNRNIVYCCKYHLVWCPKYRRRVLVDEVERRLKEIIIEQARKQNAEIIEMEIMPDHESQQWYKLENPLSLDMGSCQKGEVVHWVIVKA